MGNITKQHADAKTLQRTMEAQGIKAIHAETFTGPTVTQHAFDLDPGTNVRRVSAMTQSLALSVGEEAVRIISPIPGTKWIGIEVPNEEREDVTYDDFVSNDPPYHFGPLTVGALPVPVGVTVTSDTIWTDLTKLPHLLIAGTTGSGKSVALSTMIAHLIATQSPDTLRLHLIDPKRVELQPFYEAPQVESFASEPLDALDVLDTVVDEMDRRYETFESDGVRNIEEYNTYQSNTHSDRYRMPFHVVVVDELADLLMTGNKRIEENIVRLAQKARAAGIHLILATQRPTKDVVTGLISANVTSRWCFRVGSHVDSNVALGSSGAEALYGQGDSLWYPAGDQRPTRVQAVYTDDETIHDIVEQARIQYDRAPIASGAADDDDEFPEPLPLSLENFPPMHTFADGEELRFEADPYIEIPVDTTDQDPLVAAGFEQPASRIIPEDGAVVTLLETVRRLEAAVKALQNPKRATWRVWGKRAALTLAAAWVIGVAANLIGLT